MERAGKACTAAGFAPAGFERDVGSYLLGQIISQQELSAEGPIEVIAKRAELLVLKVKSQVKWRKIIPSNRAPQAPSAATRMLMTRPPVLWVTCPAKATGACASNLGTGTVRHAVKPHINPYTDLSRLVGISGETRSHAMRMSTHCWDITIPCVLAVRSYLSITSPTKMHLSSWLW